jgi:ABC-type glycerol-3-phosphate transport system permease component
VKLIILIIIVWLIPTLGVLISSFRPPEAVNTNGWWTVFSNLGSNEWTLSNYSDVLTSERFGSSFLNSLSVTIPATVMPITIAAFAAYGFVWMDFPGRQWLFVLVVALLVIPLQMALIPLLRLYTTVNLNGTFPAVWLAHTGFGLPLAIYLLRNYIGSLPSSMMESASIDGATPFETFTRLVVPLSVPVLASFAIFQFPLGLERPAHRLGLPGRRAGRAGGDVGAEQLEWFAWPGVAPVDRGSVHHDGVTARGVPVAAALLRARPDGGVGQGLSMFLRRSSASMVLCDAP